MQKEVLSKSAPENLTFDIVTYRNAYYLISGKGGTFVTYNWQN